MAASITIQVPIANQPYEINMGLLGDAHGYADADNANTDTPRGNAVYLYNVMITDPANPPPTPTPTIIVSEGIAVDVTPDPNTDGRYTWQSGDVSALGEDTPTANNNHLYALIFWDRDIGGGQKQPIAGPSQDDVPYKGKNPPQPAPKTKTSKKQVAATRTSSYVGITPRKHGKWLLYRHVSADSSPIGYRLLDLCGQPLRAAEIAVYGFDVNWRYTDFSQSPHRTYYVRRPIGDLLLIEPGPKFLSPSNSMIIWQNETQGESRHRQRTVIVSHSEDATDVPDVRDIVVLNSAKDVFIHLNYHRVRPLIVDGTFGLAVRVLS
jgi:hypothetical protein